MAIDHVTPRSDEPRPQDPQNNMSHHDSQDANGTMSDESPQMTRYGLVRHELIRIMIQELDDLGFDSIARHLEAESQIQALSPQVVQFRQAVLSGDWKQAELFLSQLDAFESEVNMELARAVICENKYLELLEAKKSDDALLCLQQELSPLYSKDAAQKTHLHDLTMLILCNSPEELRLRAKWPGSGPESRHEVLTRLYKLMKPTVMLPEGRLEVLLQRILKIQKEDAMFPYSVQSSMSLLEDLQFSRKKLPTKCRYTLTDHLDEVWFVQFSHDGKRLASASKDQTVRIWDMESSPPFCMLQLEGHTEPLSFLAWSADDSMLLSCGNDKLVRLWDAITGSCKQSFSKHTESVTACAWLPDNEHFVTGGLDKNIHLWNIKTGECEHTFFHSVRVNDLAVTADGKKLVVICSEKKIRVYDMISKTQCGLMQENENTTSLSLSRDGKTLLVNLSSHAQPEIRSWDLDTCQVVQKYRGQRQVRFVIRSCFGGEDQMFVVSGSEDNNVYLWNRKTGQLLEVLCGHTATVNSVTWNPKHPAMFASASDDHTIRIWGPEDPTAFSWLERGHAMNGGSPMDV